MARIPNEQPLHNPSVLEMVMVDMDTSSLWVAYGLGPRVDSHLLLFYLHAEPMLTLGVRVRKNPAFLKVSPTHWVFGGFWALLGFSGFFLFERTAGKLVT